MFFFFFSSRRRHTRFDCDWSSDVCSSDLGDHVLGLAVSDMLYRAFPKGDEGELSRRLADLVRRETCADVACAIDLGAALRLGNSESNAGGRRRMATLADVCEALIGAV